MSRRQPLDRLRDHAPAILPSLLLCDFGNLEREVERLAVAGIGGLHLDVMDGHFVPNLTYGMPIVAALRRLTDMILDAHLMISRPADYVAAFVEAGADVITIHREAVKDPGPLIDQIHGLGAAAGLAFDPETPTAAVEPYLEGCDLALVMSVKAGFGGQAFNPLALDKLKRLRSVAGDRLLLQVDGGVNADTIGDCARAGADLFVVGSAIFRQPEYGPAVRQLRSLADRSSWS
jgi:ribulose-phosphate 3-epimerase